MSILQIINNPRIDILRLKKYWRKKCYEKLRWVRKLHEMRVSLIFGSELLRRRLLLLLASFEHNKQILK